MNGQQFPAPFPNGGGGGGVFVDHAGGGGWPDGLSWVIFAVLLALLLLGVASLALNAYWRTNSGSTGALGELDLRYARGEIGRDEYLQRRADLGGPAAPVEEKKAATPARRPRTQPT